MRRLLLLRGLFCLFAIIRPSFNMQLFRAARSVSFGNKKKWKAKYRGNPKIITLKAVDKRNWEECAELEPSPEQQRFMVSNLYSIAECQFLDGFVSKTIYNDDVLIGFTMFGLDPDDGNYWVYRFMIDERFQGRGHGYHAMLLVIDEIRKASDRTDVIMIGYKPDNELARKLYRKSGFREEGISPWGEMLAKYRFA
ncbi:diamine N-acetyltransferase [Paenibacillus polymyxa]|uniref:Diamine N-acetyltransferase n=2 Tax=Paenibacillus polymyxa TaxID=1406 RepID=A0A378Y689_PAEPO|nr:diamine N-acetyltransferase [Paenibacillus polymyxa]